METVSPAQTFKTAMRRMAATVAVLSAEHAGRRFGMTATSVTSVAMDPPSLLVCINRSASIFVPISESRIFWVNLLRLGHEDTCAAFSGGKRGDDRFEVDTWATCCRNLPYLETAEANILCEVTSSLDAGTHRIFVARVIEARTQDSVSPLIYVDGSFIPMRRAS